MGVLQRKKYRNVRFVIGELSYFFFITFNVVVNEFATLYLRVRGGGEGIIKCAIKFVVETSVLLEVFCLSPK